MGLVHGIGSPHGVQELAVGQQLPFGLDQSGQQGEFNGREVQGLPIALHGVGFQIDHQVLNAPALAHGLTPRQTAAQDAQASQQLPQTEGFDQIIVGPRVQGPDFLWLKAACRQDQYGPSEFRTQALEQGQTIHIGQAQI